MRNALLNRLMLWLSLAGMVLAIHLWIQKARGFDQGCFGLDSHATAPAEGGCNDAGLQAASHLFGVSNAAWGYAFYFALALISFVKLLASPGWARRLHVAGEVATAGALVYSGRLVYHMGWVAHAWCVLCLTSAGLIAALFVLQAVLRVGGGYRPPEEPARTGEFRGAVAALFATLGVLLGVLLFFDRLGTRPLDAGSTGKDLERIIGEALPLFIDGARLREMRACRFDPEAPVLDLKKFIGPTTPFLGKADAVEVVVFYDPNCPHCQAYHPEFLRAVEQFKDRARFRVLPRLLWDESIPQAEALILAEGSGKYFVLWQAMFDRQPGPRQGMTTAQIAALFRELGIDATNLESRLLAAKPAVVAARAQAAAAGVNGTPALFIGGRKVWERNRSVECVGRLLDQAIRQR